MDYQQLITGVGTSAAPAWTEVNGKILLVWKGEGTDTRLFFTLTSSATPAPTITDKYSFPTAQNPVGAMTASANPTITTMGNVAYLAYCGTSDDGICWAKYSDGTWTDLHRISFGGQNHSTNRAPSIASNSKALFLAWIDSDSGGIGWATCTDGETWGEQQQVAAGSTGGTPTTGEAPAIAAIGQDVHVVWKGRSDDGLYWSYLSGGKWSPQTYLKSGTSAGPALAVDGNEVLWAAWKGANADAGIYYKRLLSPTTMQWSDQVNRYFAGTSAAPYLASTSKGPTGLMLVWKGAGSDPGIYYGPMELPPQTLTFTLPSFHISNMRSGSLLGKTESDTDYVSFGLAIVGQTPQVKTLSVGDQTGGNVNVGLNFSKVTVQDTDTVILNYAIINSSSGPSQSAAFLEKNGAQLLSAAEKAYLLALTSLSKLPFSALTPQEEGALIGAQLGGIILPGLGVVLGAIAGWFVDSVAGFLWPNCDGPVANGLYVWSGPALRALMVQNPNGHVQADDNPGVNSASGCGSNSDYQVTWQITSQ
jgi:hypothetical protein